MVGEEIYGEGEDDITETIALALASGKSVKTSRPSPGQFEQAFLAAERRGYEAVVSIHISGGLSGTADAARLAAGRVSIPVEVIDSGTVGMALGMGVQAAVVAAAAGAGRCRRSAPRRRSSSRRTKVYFYVPSLEQLRRGGRIGAAASLLGTMLAIKPILAVDGGKIVPLEKVRSAARAIARLEEIAAADAASRPARPGPPRRPPLRESGRGRGAGGQAGRRPARAVRRPRSVPCPPSSPPTPGWVSWPSSWGRAPRLPWSPSRFPHRAGPACHGWLWIHSVGCMSRRDAGARQWGPACPGAAAVHPGGGAGLLTDGGGKVFEYDGGAQDGGAGPASGSGDHRRGRHGQGRPGTQVAGRPASSPADCRPRGAGRRVVLDAGGCRSTPRAATQ